MKIEPISIQASDGFTLEGSLYRPPTTVTKVIVITSALGVVRSYYQQYAMFMCNHGYMVLTFDYRGVGESRPKSLRGFQATMHDWGQRDIAAAIDWVDTVLQPHRLFMVSHSAGGQLLGLAHNSRRIDAMVAVAVPSGYWRHWPLFQRYRFLLMWHLLVRPLARGLGYLPAKRLGFGEDLPQGVALEWASWCLHRDYLFGFGDQLDLSLYSQLKIPILVYSIADDQMAPKMAVDALFKGYENARITRSHVLPAGIGVSHIGHFGFFKEKFRDSLWPETLEWISRI